MKKKICNILLIILSIILMGILIFNIFRLDMIPNKYLVLILTLISIIYIISLLFILIKKKVLNIIGYILMILIIIISSVGIYYTNITLKFIKDSFNNINVSYTNNYILMSKNDYNEVYDFIDSNIGYYENIPNVNIALDKLNSIIDYNRVSYTDILELFNEDNILIEKSLLETLKENITEIDYASYKVVYEYEIVIDEEINIDEVKDVVNIYIGGVDFTETFNDFNMIVTINKKTHKILLTSIPRDYYFYFNSLNTNELLDYTLLWGVNVPIEGLETLFDTHIDYYMTINTKSIVGLVDEIGGVKFCSDFAFTTTHATILETYDDSKGNRLYVEKGCKEYNGIEILTIARERLVFAGGDRQRQKNCQQIMINIFNKMLSVDSITNYTNLLDKLSDLYITNIPDKLVTSLAKDVIDGNKWEIDVQSADGASGAGWVHINTYYGNIMRPYPESVESVKNKLKEYYE